MKLIKSKLVQKAKYPKKGKYQITLEVTIKQIAKNQMMSYSSVRYHIRKLNEAGIIKPCGMKGKETLWGLSDWTFEMLKKEGVFNED
jgi:DNA-binding transcriptional ArsR family regulator|tara:strand:- start:313 stop:573 length:261 start_codon:yes stop_codon:yes gene_type:complete